MNKIFTIVMVLVIVVCLFVIVSFTGGPSETQPTPNPPTSQGSEMPDCIEEGSIIPNIENPPPCCEGLTATNFSMPDAYGGCPAEKDKIICANCGDGECGQMENTCSCPADCILPPSEIGRAFDNDTAYSIYKSEIKYLLDEVLPGRGAGVSVENVLGHLYENDPALMRDIIAADKNPDGFLPYADSHSTGLEPVDEKYALQLLESVVPNADNTTIEDSGDHWTACATSGGTETCCEIPKLYGPSAQLSCS